MGAKLFMGSPRTPIFRTSAPVGDLLRRGPLFSRIYPICPPGMHEIQEKIPPRGLFYSGNHLINIRLNYFFQKKQKKYFFGGVLI